MPQSPGETRNTIAAADFAITPFGKQAANRSHWLPITFVGLCGLINLMLPTAFFWLARGGFGNYLNALIAAYAVVTAQLAAIGLWLAWSWQPFWRRMIVHSLLVVLLWAIGLTGFLGWQILHAEPVLELLLNSSTWLTVAFLPSVAFMTQLPAWIVRLVFRVRLEHSQHVRSLAQRRLSIADLLASMTMFSMIVASLRATMLGLGYWERGLLWVVSFHLIVAACFPLPTAWFVLRAATWPRATLWAIGWCSVGYAVPLLSLQFWWQAPLINYVKFFGPMLTTIIVPQLILILAARLANYRIVAGRPNTAGGAAANEGSTTVA